LDWFDKEELIKRFISVEFNRFLEYYRNAVDLNQKESSSKGGSKSERKQKSSGGGGMTRLFINLGKVDGLYPQGLMKLLNSMTKGSKPDFGNIDIQKNFTLFEVEADAAPKLIAAFKHKEIEGRKIFIKADEDHKSPESRGKFSREKSDRKRPVSNESGFFRERDDNKRSKYPKKRGDDFRGKRKDSAKGKGDRRRRK
jgi:ATP-dependent RNA helicase DeaD